MLAEKGFNEMELNLLKHLLKNKKPVVFVRTKCDCELVGLKHQGQSGDTEESDSDSDDSEEDENKSFEDGMNIIKKALKDLICKEVLIDNDVKMKHLGLVTSNGES